MGAAGAVTAGATFLGAWPAAANESGTGTGPVVDREWVGGLVSPDVTALRAPRLVVYADGLAITDADHQSRLDTANLRDPRRHMVTVLADPAGARRRPGVPIIADAPATRFAVRAAHGTLYSSRSPPGPAAAATSPSNSRHTRRATSPARRWRPYRSLTTFEIRTAGW
jgi:hypothetical protein